MLSWLPCGTCFSFLKTPEDYARERADFERTVAFLGSVPLFRQQLPRAQLPKVAQHLSRKVWRPGDRLVRQGETGKAFFLIQAGEALVVTSEDNRTESVRATLTAGDYFGGHTLTTERPNVATVIAGGNEGERLVTLSLSRNEFKNLGLVQWLSFPKRPAIYEGVQMDTDILGSRLQHQSTATDLHTQAEELPEQEQEFIRKAILKNANLRALLNLEDKVQELAAAAVRREFPAKQVVAKAGDVGQEFFIVREGSVVAVVESCLRGAEQQSLENAVAHSTMAERVMRKQHFLQELCNGHPQHTPRGARGAGAAASMFMPSKERQGSAAGASLFKLLRGGSNSTIAAEEASAAITKNHSTGTPSSALETWARQISRGSNSSAGAASKNVVPSLEALPLPSAAAEAADDGTWSRQTSGCDSSECSEDFRNRSCAAKYRRFSEFQRVPSGKQMPLPARKAATPDDTRCSVIKAGDSFGELSVLYNMHSHATFRTQEPTTMYVVRRRQFTAAFNRKGRRFNDYVKLLEEVTSLGSLLGTERYELACHVTGMVEFQPGECVLMQGRVRLTRRWYIIFKGSAVVTHDHVVNGEETNEKLAELYRAAHFGERSLLTGAEAPEVSVCAGSEGMTCVVFDGEEVKVLLKKVLERGEEVPNVEDLKEWWRTKVGRGFNVDRGDDSPDRGQEVWDITANNCHVTLEDLTKVCILGKGGYGQVILVKETAHQDRKYALKVLSKGHIEEQGAQRLVSWERELLSMIDSPFVIRLHRTFKDAQYVYFLLEAAMGGSLASVLNDVPEVFNEDSPRGWSMGFYAACITAALEHLHERRIVHRDLKPENVLLDEEGYAKVCDMGFARFVLSRTNTLAGTPDYMAPEMISFPHTHCCAVDWWALGVLCFELLAGQTPFQDEGICDPVGRLLAIRRSQERGICHYPYHFPSIAKPFVSHLLQNDPKDRLGAGPRGASEVRAEPIFRALKFDFDALHAQTLRSPYRKAWEEPRERDASGADCHNFGMDEDDSIFIKAGSTAVCAVGSFATWDAKF